MIIVVIIIILYFVWFQLLTCFHLNPRFLLVFFFQKWCKRGRKSVSKPSCQLRLNHNRWKKHLNGKKHLWSLFVEHMLHHTVSSWNEDVHWYPHVWLIKMASSKPGASKSRMMTQLTFLFLGHKIKPKTGGQTPSHSIWLPLGLISLGSN